MEASGEKMHACGSADGEASGCVLMGSLDVEVTRDG